jgi:hypothetical protein
VAVPVVFAISLKSRRLSSDWNAAQANLRRTLRSIEHSGQGHLTHVCVACHDEPDIAAVDTSMVTVLKVPFPEPVDVVSEGKTDRARKRRYIGSWLRGFVDENVHVMFLDADDLVHKDLVSAVLRSSSLSQIVTDGYFVDAAAGVMTLRRGSFYKSCGSSFVSRFRKDELPTSWEDLDAPYSQFGSSPEHRGHQDYDRVAIELDRPAAPFDFPAIAYLVNHTESMWRAKGRGERKVGSPRELVRPSTARSLLANEFAAPDLARQLAGASSFSAIYARSAIARLRARASAAASSRSFPSGKTKGSG